MTQPRQNPLQVPSSSVDILSPPSGYSRIQNADSQVYLVPTFMVQKTQMDLDIQKKKLELDIDAAAPGPCSLSSEPYVGVAAGEIQVPVEPQPSEREALNAHAAILAVQERWGISYKDAAQRLYLAEIEKFRVGTQAANALLSIRNAMDKSRTHEVHATIKHIDDLKIE